MKRDHTKVQLTNEDNDFLLPFSFSLVRTTQNIGICQTMSDNHTISACRILYSTQSGRAKACARRTARIVAEQYGITLQNGQGSAVDQDVMPSVPDFASHLRESGALLLLFVSTTGDGEHTVIALSLKLHSCACRLVPHSSNDL